MTTNQTMTVDLSKLNGGSHGPALPPAKRKVGAPVETVSYKPKDVVAAKVAALEAKRNAKPVGPKLKHEPVIEEVVTPVETIVNPDAPPIVQAMQAAAEAGCLKELVNAVFPSDPAPVSDSELAEALAITERATKQQAEAIREAAAKRKKVAPEGVKVKPVKELTDAQKAKLAKAAKAAETYPVVCSAAMGLAGKGLAESVKMQTALSFVPLPALRWLAKQFEGVAIPKDKRSAADIREFVRVELLTYNKPYQFGDLTKMELKS